MATAGCVDTTPVIVLNGDEDGNVAVVADAATVLADCLRCTNTPDVPGPGCLDEVTACRENSLCAAILVCAITDGCFVVPTREEEVRCGTRCADKIGIGSSTDPAVVLGAQLDACVRANCSKVCPAYAH
ncbi:MAG: hypothetical protein NVS3B10_15000 [Polyangiales bacterium]